MTGDAHDHDPFPYPRVEVVDEGPDTEFLVYYATTYIEDLAANG